MLWYSILARRQGASNDYYNICLQRNKKNTCLFRGLSSVWPELYTKSRNLEECQYCIEKTDQTAAMWDSLQFSVETIIRLYRCTCIVDLGYLHILRLVLWLNI